MKPARILLLVTASLLLTLSTAFAQGVTIKKDVVYATHDGVQLPGDLYLPATPGPRLIEFLAKCLGK